MSIPDEDPRDTVVETVVQSADNTDRSAPAEEGLPVSGFGDALDGIMADIEKKPRGEDGKFLPEKKEETEAPLKTEEPAEEVKPLEETVAPEVKPEPVVEKPTGTDRDADLKDAESKLDPHSSPKTKANFKAMTAKIAEARNAVDAEKAAHAKKDAEIETLRKAGVPKETQEELEYLRGVVREIDVARDPAIIAKYDKKIQGNEAAVLKILEKNGYGTDSEGKPIPGRMEQLKKDGLNRKNLEASIAALEKGGLHEDADELKDLLRQNYNLSKDKDREVGEMKTGFEARKQQEAAQTERTVAEANAKMTAEFKAHVDKHDFLKVPPKVDPADGPVIRKEKEKSIAVFNDRIMRLSEAIKKEASDPMSAATTARIGILYRDHVAPELANQLAATRKELDSVKAQMKAMKGAGSISEKQGAGKPVAAAKQDVDTSHQGFDDIVDQIARTAGVLK